MTLHGATILQVIPDLGAGGAERTTVEVAEAICKAGGRALVASAGGRLEDELASVGGELLRRESLPSKNPLTMRRNADWLANIIRKEHVGIIHARSRAPAWGAYWAAKRTHCPFVTTYHGAYNARSAAKRWYNSVMARGETVIANSQFIAAHVAHTYPQASDRIVAIPRGVDLTRYGPGKVPAARIDALAAQWFSAPPHNGRKPDHPVILLPGRLTAWKGQTEAIDAMATIARKGNTDWTLILAGDDQGRTGYLDALKAQISAANLDEHVLIVGHCADMPAAYALCDIVIAPSREPEAFGRVAAEAGAFGRPVIVSDHGGQVEIVTQDITGYRVPPGDADALSSGIQRLLDADTDTLTRMAEAAMAHVSAHFSTEALQAATLNVYARLLEKA